MANGAFLKKFDISNFTCTQTFAIRFRVEDTSGMLPTLRKFLIIYRDVGVFNGLLYIKGFDENLSPTSVFASFTLGTQGADGLIKQQYVDLVQTILLPRVEIRCDLNKDLGPFSIISLSVIGDGQERGII